MMIMIFLNRPSEKQERKQFLNKVRATFNVNFQHKAQCQIYDMIVAILFCKCRGVHVFSFEAIMRYNKPLKQNQDQDYQSFFFSRKVSIHPNNTIPVKNRDDTLLLLSKSKISRHHFKTIYVASGIHWIECIHSNFLVFLEKCLQNIKAYLYFPMSF